jgi:hypothetical protein
MKPLRRLPFGPSLFFAAWSAWSGSAFASPSFPGELQDQLDMPCVPQCTLCHRDSNGGVGTATRPFGAAVQSAGLELKRPDLIATVLAALERGRFDSDEDGILDVDELRQGDNPNQSGQGFLCATYGCTARVAPAAADSALVPSIGILLAVAVGLARLRSVGRRT